MGDLNFNEFFSSLFGEYGLLNWQAVVSIVIVIAVILLIVRKYEIKLTTKEVVAIGIGSALYAVLSAVAIPIGPNTQFRIAIALLIIFGAIYGPVTGFLVGFIGHALNDALMYGGIWWSWVFLSAVLGLFAGLITLKKDFNVLNGRISKHHIVLMYVYTFVGMIVADLVAYLGDVFLYGEPFNKVLVQIIIASLSNAAVIAAVGIPVVVLIAKSRSQEGSLELEE